MVVVAVTGMRYRSVKRRRSVISHAAGEFVADRDTAAAKHIRVGDGGSGFLLSTDRHWAHACRIGRVAPLDRAIVEWPLLVLPVGCDLLPALRCRAAADKNVRIERRRRCHCKDLPVIRIERDDRAALCRGIRKLVLSLHLEIEIDRRHKILPGLRWDNIKLGLDPAATVDEHLTIAVMAPQALVIVLFQAPLADDVAGKGGLEQYYDEY